MSNKSFSKRSKSKSYRPPGGMKRELVKRDMAGDDRESMVGGRIIDEPVFAETGMRRPSTKQKMRLTANRL